MPYALGVLINLSHAVEWDSMDLAIDVNELEGLWAVLGKGYILEGHQDDAVFRPVVISQLKVPFGKLRIPADAAK